MLEHYDLVVIGGGPAGYVGAIRAAQLGKKVACVEMDRVGGTCLNWGCIPSKSLLRTAELYQFLNHRARDFGLEISELSFDWSKVIGRSRKVTDQLAGGIEFLFKKNNVQYIRGQGELTKPNLVTVKLPEEKTRLLQAGSTLVCSGVRPRPLPSLPFNGVTVISSKEALLLTKRPSSMIIIGAGAIGVEFAYFYNAFGTQVTLLEMAPYILPMEDREVSQNLSRSFQKQGIRVHTGTKVKGGKATKTGIQLFFDGENSGSIEAEIILVAVGVEPLVPTGLALKRDRDFVKVDGKYQTAVAGIYAAGDVIGPPWLAHIASYEAVQVVEGLFGHHHPKRISHYPSCTYCQPQVASIGLTEKAAKKLGKKYRVGRFPFKASGKALSVGETDGFVKLILGEPSGKILGAHIIGAEATELIAELGLAMTLEATFEEITATIHAHPTLGEAIHEASAAAFHRAIHL